MPQIAPDSLLSLEAYARERNAYRARVIAHKRLRTVHARRARHADLRGRADDPLPGAGDAAHRAHLRGRRASADELEAYNPLIPDGGNLKATMLIEYPDAESGAAARAN